VACCSAARRSPRRRQRCGPAVPAGPGPAGRS
jgi:hypothetical protein